MKTTDPDFNFWNYGFTTQERGTLDAQATVETLGAELEDLQARKRGQCNILVTTFLGSRLYYGRLNALTVPAIVDGLKKRAQELGPFKKESQFLSDIAAKVEGGRVDTGEDFSADTMAQFLEKALTDREEGGFTSDGVQTGGPDAFFTVERWGRRFSITVQED